MHMHLECTVRVPNGYIMIMRVDAPKSKVQGSER